MASEWQTAFVVSQNKNAMVCLSHWRQELQQKSWKTARLFLQDWDQDQMFKTKTYIFVLEAPRDQVPGLDVVHTILIFLGLSVLDLGPMYVTDRQTSDSIIALCPRLLG